MVQIPPLLRPFPLILKNPVIRLRTSSNQEARGTDFRENGNVVRNTTKLLAGVHPSVKGIGDITDA